MIYVKSLKDALIRAAKVSFSIPEKLPSYTQIAITNLCNLECPMCFRNFIKLEIKHMDYEVFRKVIDKLKGLQSISLSGYGEPLCYPRIFEAIRYCKQKGFALDVTTNGLLLNTDEKIKELIFSGLDSITFSFESVRELNDITHPNQAALANVKELIRAKKKINSKTPFISLQTLMIKDKEKDLFDVIEWGAINGVDRINVARFEQFNTLNNVEKPNLQEEKKIFKKFSHLRKKYRIRIDCLQDQVDTGLKGFLYKNFKYLLRMDNHCIRLKDFVYINVDGDVLPCCALSDCRIDSLLENDLETIWRSEKYYNFRKRYHKIPWCVRCDFAKLKQVTKEDL